MPLAIENSSFPIVGQSTEPVRLSKSRFLAGLQCLKRLYLQTFAAEPDISINARQQGQFDQGQQVGELAHAAFPGGAVVPFVDSGLDDALAETAALIDDTSIPAIFEATFRFNGIVVRVDILQRQPGNQWRLIEVKSSTSYKDHYLYDIAIQRHVLVGCGLHVNSSCLMHLNREYIFEGNCHDTAKLFTIVDLSLEVNQVEQQIPQRLLEQQRTLQLATAPEVESGEQCVVPYQCEFFSACNRTLPEHHVSTLPHLSHKKADMLTEAGISLIPDIPANFPLSELQRKVRVCVKSGKPLFSESLLTELSALEYPLCFMDFETTFPAVPRLRGMWPYSHIPFQWSVHRQQTPDAEAEHFEFLAENEADSRCEFFDGLSRVLGDRGNIIAYNATFETQRLDDLAGWFPQYRARVDAIKSRVWDLLPFVRRNVYHPDFRGSFSLKAVLPAFLPELTYEGMEVGNGEDAGIAWEHIVRAETNADEKARIKQALLAYCRQDTWALVALFKLLLNSAQLRESLTTEP